MFWTVLIAIVIWAQVATATEIRMPDGSHPEWPLPATTSRLYWEEFKAAWINRDETTLKRFEAAGISINLPQGTKVYVIESYEDSPRKVRVIDGAYAGMIVYVAPACLHGEAPTPVPTRTRKAKRHHQ